MIPLVRSSLHFTVTTCPVQPFIYTSQYIKFLIPFANAWLLSLITSADWACQAASAYFRWPCIYALTKE
jgi:hypothetical protein